MGAPTVYYYDDPGAPVLNNYQDAFYQILMACLVNGYGSKPAAGWSVVYDEWAAAGHASFTNDTASGVLGVVRNTTVNYGPYLYVAEAMIDYQTAVNSRSGMRSNINPATLATDSLSGRQRAHGVSWQKWVCIADEQGAWLFFSNTDDRLFNPWGLRHESLSYRSIYFGAATNFFGLGERSAALLGNFLIAGGLGDSYNNSEWFVVNSNCPSTLMYSSSGYVADDGSLLGIYPLFCNAYSYFVANAADDAFSRFPLYPVQIVDYGSANASRIAVSELGMTKSSWELGASGSSTYSRMFANRIQPAGQTLRDPVLIDGVPHLMAPMGYYAYALISLAEADWA